MAKRFESNVKELKKQTDEERKQFIKNSLHNI